MDWSEVIDDVEVGLEVEGFEGAGELLVEEEAFVWAEAGGDGGETGRRRGEVGRWRGAVMRLEVVREVRAVVMRGRRVVIGVGVVWKSRVQRRKSSRESAEVASLVAIPSRRALVAY